MESSAHPTHRLVAAQGGEFEAETGYRKEIETEREREIEREGEMRERERQAKRERETEDSSWFQSFEVDYKETYLFTTRARRESPLTVARRTERLRRARAHCAFLTQWNVVCVRWLQHILPVGLIETVQAFLQPLPRHTKKRLTQSDVAQIIIE